MMNDLKSHKLFKGINFETIFEQEIPMMMDDSHTDPTEKQKQRLQKMNNIISKQYMDVL